jgi:glycosyltransferase involved in cell wall biosynthesis
MAAYLYGKLKVSAMLSIVIPIHNEEPSILPLYDRLTSVLESLQKPYEILFVDDASTDRSFDLLANLVETDMRLKVIRLRRNFGQTAALSAGFDEAQTVICSTPRRIFLRCLPRSTKATISRAAGVKTESTMLSPERFLRALRIG